MTFHGCCWFLIQRGSYHQRLSHEKELIAGIEMDLDLRLEKNTSQQVKWCKVCVQAFVCECVCVCVFDVHTYFEIVWWLAAWLLYNFLMRMGLVRETKHARFERWVCWPPKAGVFIFGYLSFTSSTQTLPGKWMVSRCLSYWPSLSIQSYG